MPDSARAATGAEAGTAGANYELGIRRDYKVGVFAFLSQLQESSMDQMFIICAVSHHCHSSEHGRVFRLMCLRLPLVRPSAIVFICASQVGLPEAARVKRYIPFSDGRRDCVGQALGRLNYTSTLARLLGNFHFELAPEVLSCTAAFPLLVRASCTENPKQFLQSKPDFLLC